MTARFNVLVIRDDSVAAVPVALVGLEGEPEPGQSPLLRRPGRGGSSVGSPDLVGEVVDA